MDFVKSALYLDVRRVLSSPRPQQGNQVEVTIHIGNQQTLKPMRFISRDIFQDYINHYGDATFLSVLMSGRDYYTLLYPNRTNLYITTRDSLVHANSNAAFESTPSYSERYKAVLLDEHGSAILEHAGRMSPDAAQLDLNGLMEVNFQLISEPLNLLRMYSVSRAYASMTGEQLVRAAISEAIAALPMDDTVRPLGVNIVPTNNPTVYRQQVIPQGVKVQNLADYVQNNLGGLYNAGLGNYYAGRMWWVFPLYNTDRQDQVEESLTIINVPQSVMPSVERTYLTEGKHTTVLATGEIRFTEDAEEQQLNSGNGVRFANADGFMESRFTVENNKLKYKRNSNVTEVVTAQRGDKLNFAPMAAERITANAMAQYSRLARRDGSMVVVNWEYANPALLKPGMAIKLLYLDGAAIRELRGTLLSAHQYTFTSEQINFGARYRTNVALAVFVNRKNAYL